MSIIQYFIGKTAIVPTETGVNVELVIENITNETKVVQITPDTPQNDWWGETVTVHFYNVKFINGYVRRYNNLEEIMIKQIQ